MSHLNGALQNNSQGILGDSFCWARTFPREVHALPLGSSHCPTSLKQLSWHGTVFASCCLKAAGSGLVVLLFGNCCLKLESFLLAICARQKMLSAGLFKPPSTGKRKLLQHSQTYFGEVEKQMTVYEVLLKLYLFGII